MKRAQKSAALIGYKSILLSVVGVGATAFFAALLMRYAGTFYLTALKAGIFMGLLAVIVGYSILFRWQKTRAYFSGYTLTALILCLAFFSIGLVALTQGRLLVKDKGTAITYDEVSILPVGYFYRQTGTYYINPEHPPLVKLIAAIPSALQEAKMPKEQLSKDVLLQDFAQYYWGKVFLFESNNQTERIIFWARFSVFMMNSILFFLLYISLAKFWNKRAAFIALFFLLVSPFTLAHSMLVTVDIMAAILSAMTLLWFGVFLHSFGDTTKVRMYGAVTAVTLAGALLAKFSAILLVPIMFVIVAAYAVSVRSNKARPTLKNVLLSNLAVFSTALLLIVVFYSWHVRAMTSEQIVEQLRYNFVKDHLPMWVHTFIEQTTRFGSLGRGFAEFALGLIKVNTRIANGAGGVYFMGTYYGNEGAGMWYFPLLYLTKLPILFHVATLGLMFVAVRTAISRGFKGIQRFIANNTERFALLVYGLVFMGISIGSTLQIGLRHVFPAIFCFTLLVAYGLDAYMTQSSKRYPVISKRLVPLGGALMIVSLLLAHPHYLSYYNLAGGGTNNGYKIASDSNYDWGQDLKELAVWKQQNNVGELYVDLFANPFLPIKYYLGEDAKIYRIAKDKPLPQNAYIAVSATQLTINQGGKLPDEKRYDQYKENFVTRIGTSIFVYKTSK